MHQLQTLEISEFMTKLLIGIGKLVISYKYKGRKY